jgi:hypothetical protein
MTVAEGEMSTVGAVFTVTVTVFEITEAPAVSLTRMEIELDPADAGVKVHVALVAPVTNVPFRYHW